MRKLILSAVAAIAFMGCTVTRQAQATADNEKTGMAISQKKTTTSPAAIDGRWQIVSLGEMKEIESAMEGKKPYVTFSIKDMRVTASVGCNTLSATMVTEEGNPASLSFSKAISTMMACPDMEAERTLSLALELCRSFTVENGTLVMLDAEGKPLAVLSR